MNGVLAFKENLVFSKQIREQRQRAAQLESLFLLRVKEYNHNTQPEFYDQKWEAQMDISDAEGQYICKISVSLVTCLSFKVGES